MILLLKIEQQNDFNHFFPILASIKMLHILVIYATRNLNLWPQYESIKWLLMKEKLIINAKFVANDLAGKPISVVI